MSFNPGFAPGFCISGLTVAFVLPRTAWLPPIGAVSAVEVPGVGLPRGAGQPRCRLLPTPNHDILRRLM